MRTPSGNTTRCVDVARGVALDRGLAVTTLGVCVSVPLTVIVSCAWMSASALELAIWTP